MVLVVGAVLVGVTVGLAFGGSLRTLSELRLQWWPLALVGLGLQLVPVPSRQGQLDHWLAVALLMVAYGVLLVFVGANIRLPGFPLVALGFALNLLIISINGGMPVSDSAMRSTYGSGYADMRRELIENGGAKHHLAGPDDDLRLLSDVIPLGPPVRLILSVGDVLFYVGVVWLLAAATKGPRGKHRLGATRGSLDRLDPRDSGPRLPQGGADRPPRSAPIPP
jgi:Family of unknown function (DUF5317)